MRFGQVFLILFLIGFLVFFSMFSIIFWYAYHSGNLFWIQEFPASEKLVKIWPYSLWPIEFPEKTPPPPTRQEILEKEWQEEWERYPKVNSGTWPIDLRSRLLINEIHWKEMIWQQGNKVLKHEVHLLLTYQDGKIRLGIVEKPYSDSKYRLKQYLEDADQTRLLAGMPEISRHGLEKDPQLILIPQKNWFKKFLNFANIATYLFLLGMMVMVILLSIFVNWLMTRGRLRLPPPWKTDKTFADIGGMEKVRKIAEGIEEMAKFPQIFYQKGGGMPRGFLFSGAPGTGKTLAAAIIANEVNIPCYKFTCTEFIRETGGEVGAAASRLKDIFSQARKKGKPCILIFDEVDVLAEERGRSGATLREELSVALTQFLNELGGIEEYDRLAFEQGTLRHTIVVLALTNRPEIIDEALLRSGRIGEHILFPIPGIKARREILQIHAKDKDFPPTKKEKWLDWLAQETPGCTGADLEEILKRAANFAARREISKLKAQKIPLFTRLAMKFSPSLRERILPREKITLEDLKIAREEVLNEIWRKKEERKFRPVTREDKQILSYHQAGHQLLTRILRGAARVNSVSIIPGREGFQQTFWLEELLEKEPSLTNQDFLQIVSVYGGGQAAEDLHFRKISAWGTEDLKKATDLVIRMVSEMGMQKGFPYSVIDRSEEERRLSEQTLAEREKEVRKLMQKYWQEKPREILRKNWEAFQTLANEIFEKEDLTKNEINKILDKFELSS